MLVHDYVAEEVARQGHNVQELDGIERVGWMMNGWAYALIRAEAKPTMADAERLGTAIEPRRNTGFRKVNVRVGMRLYPEWHQVNRLLTQLFEKGALLTPIEFYKKFEEVHPFVDGNGRTGKILLNWLNGTLLDPIFPPANLFGAPIQNP